VSDCCLTPNSAIFQLDHGENKLIVNEMMKRSAVIVADTNPNSYHYKMTAMVFTIIYCPSEFSNMLALRKMTQVK
jgi:hypothetical protein